MAREDLIRKVAYRTEFLQEDVALILRETIDVIRELVSDGKEVRLDNFGVFKTRRRPQKIARNLKGKINGKRKKPEPIVLPATDVPHFKISKKFMKAA